METRTVPLSVFNTIRVTLRRRGCDAIREHYKWLHLPDPRYSPGNFYTGPLWEIMQIFGSKCFGDADPPFDNVIEVDIPVQAIQKARVR